ncbi:MAG TPA: hypothetical protein VL134_02225, partial [Leptolyngbya sp.]|nr:hypothetical protein [Leptolyngbya sp.]
MSRNLQPFNSQIANCIGDIQAFAIREFDRQIQRHQLYYHTHDHIAQVQRRSRLIFAAIRSDLASESIERMELLLNLCVVAHDMVQVFEAPSPPHTARQRSTGVSERATIDRLLNYINAHWSTNFSELDRSIIQSAINATT